MNPWREPRAMRETTYVAGIENIAKYPSENDLSPLVRMNDH